LHRFTGKKEKIAFYYSFWNLANPGPGLDGEVSHGSGRNPSLFRSVRPGAVIICNAKLFEINAG
jgi:hypothetical protein